MFSKGESNPTRSGEWVTINQILFWEFSQDQFCWFSYGLLAPFLEPHLLGESPCVNPRRTSVEWITTCNICDLWTLLTLSLSLSLSPTFGKKKSIVFREWRERKERDGRMFLIPNPVLLFGSFFLRRLLYSNLLSLSWFLGMGCKYCTRC